MKGRIFFRYGFILGVIMLSIQGILIKVIGIPLLVLLYLFIAIYSLLSHEYKLFTGMVAGYIMGVILFIIFVYILYNIMIFLAGL